MYRADRAIARGRCSRDYFLSVSRTFVGIARSRGGRALGSVYSRSAGYLVRLWSRVRFVRERLDSA